MRRRLFRVCAAAFVGLMLVSALASGALADGARRRGSCDGRGHWELRVDRESAHGLRVRFEVDDVRQDDTWQVFLSDDGVRIFAGTRTSTDGDFRVRTLTRDRRGRDRIRASAVDIDASGSCAGSVRF
jgi:hypothetical protein